ncbi:MAG: NTP transferase domain-containing protein [Deltaproteobacteria bacterium]|nr:NTP transferase domain-containing protein [Deltaproteobacteria bacterium]MCL4873163.1 mannose-1-phosphate guanyltransferase [bacterium]
MKSIIMAGGFGTRLRPLTNNLPKPMVPMANRPMMEHIIGLLKSHGIKDLTALLYFQPEMISGHLGDGSAFGVKLDYITLTVDLGTAGAVGSAMRKMGGGGTTLIISGDVLTDIDLQKAVSFHRERKAAATIVLTRVENPLPFGIVITDEEGRIIRFLEKPSWGEVFSDTINTGIYILEQKVLDYIPADREFDFSKDLFPLMLDKKEPLYGYIAEGYWKDVGSLEEYRAANMDILQGSVHVEVPGERIDGRRLWVGKGSRIDFTAKLEGSIIIGENCRIGAEARISNSIIGPGSIVEEGAVILDSVIWDSTKVAHGASLHENVVARGSEILDQAHLAEGVIVSDHCRIGRNSTIKANVKVWPYKVVEDDATLASSLIWGEKWSRNIFSTYGVTGLANIELSPEFAAKLGAAYGASLKKGAAVSTSRDAHKTSRMINRAIMTGILSTGVNVHDYGVTPMPVVRFLARSGTEAGGVHTRRSPFDPQLVDLKFFDGKGLDLHPGYEKTIEKLFFKEDFLRAPMEETGEMSFPVHGFESYQNGFLSMIDSETISRAGFRFVVDYSYGSSSRIFPYILGKLNCEVIALNANLDGSKTTKSPEEFQRAMDQLSSIVRSLDADMGFYLDAGGEKVFLFDETGEALDGDTALNIVTLLVLKFNKEAGRKGHIAVPVTASRAIDRMAETYGFGVRRTKTTPRGQMEAAASEGALFVGEQSGGFIFPDFQPNFDGMYAIAKLLEMLSKHGTRLHRLMREIPPSIIIKDRVSCSFESKGMVMRRLAEDSRDLDTVLLDGIKIKFGEDWLVAYPSQDMPYFNLVAEASTEEAARSLVNKYAEKIKGWQRS